MQPDDRDEPGGHPFRRHSALWRSCLVFAWLATVSLAAIAALRIFYHDGTNTLTCINAFTRYVYLPVYACIAWAIWQRRWFLLLAGVAVAVCHLTWMAPEFIRDRRFDAAGNSGAAVPSDLPTIRIFFANVSAYNELTNDFLAEIATVNPDVVVFVEFLPWWRAAARNSTALKPYIYGTPQRQPLGGEIALYSKIPIEIAQQMWVTGRPSLAFDINVGGKPLRIFCLHSPRPIPWPLERPEHNYRRYWETMMPTIFAQPDPAVVLGDFNATPHSRVYRTLTEGRWRSAHDDRGRGYAATWPNGQFLAPPIRIDHAFLTPGVECVQISEGMGIGSDHKPLILDVRLR
jgi:endonuclease/exonuclease/phosphatase (EEP) superfamily protein YafD